MTTTLLQDYQEKCYPTWCDIHEHLPILLAYTKQCDSVVECGVRSIVSSYAFAAGLVGTPNNTYSLVDPYKDWQIDPFIAKCKTEGVNATFYHASDLDVPLIPTDLLFIDTWHVYGHLKRELNYWNSSVKKFIIMHDTTVDEWHGETIRCNMDPVQQSKDTGIPIDEITRGLWPAVEEFLQDHPEWKIDLRLVNNNGLTILKRITKKFTT
jgi:hypothetical protein